MNLLKSFSVVLSFISIASMAFSPLIILSLVALIISIEMIFILFLVIYF